MKGKIKTKNPFAANLSSVAGTKRSMMNASNVMGGVRDSVGDPNFRRVTSPIREETTTMQSGRGAVTERRHGGPSAAGGLNNEDQEDWYRPELGEIPYAPLTRANREKIEKRDREIAEKEAELAEIMENI